MLIGDKICLGPVLGGDAPLLFNWIDALPIVHASGAYRPVSEAKFAEWLAGFSNDQGRVIFAIRRHGDLRLIGYVQLTNIHPVLRSAELGIVIGGPQDQNQGFGQEAVRLATRYCWRELNLERVWLTVLANNPRARRAYEKCGYALEGTLRRAAFSDGAFHDLLLMAVLRGQSST